MSENLVIPTPGDLAAAASAKAPATGDVTPDTEDAYAALRETLSELGLAPGQLRERLEASKKWESRAKSNAAAAQRLAEIEEASKSEAQKAAEAAQRTAKERDDAMADAARLRAAVKYGLTEDDLTHLDGIPADRVEAIAEWVASRAPAPKLPPAPPATGQGEVGKPIGDGSDIDAEIAAAQKAGNVALSIYLKSQKAAAAARP